MSLAEFVIQPPLSVSELGPIDSSKVERYDRPLGRSIIRTVLVRSGTAISSTIPCSEPHREVATDSSEYAAMFDAAWLRSSARPRIFPLEDRPEVRIVDLFSGFGGMTLGAVEACRALRLQPNPVLAIDFQEAAAKVYEANFPEARVESAAIERILDGEMSHDSTAAEKTFIEKAGRIDLLLGGPPCQGHSDLNNRTRRTDDKNALMLKMARFAELVEPDHIIIENVPGALHDRGGVVERTRTELVRLGYHVDHGLVNIGRLGIPQRRRRFVLIASRNYEVCLKPILAAFETTPRTVRWAIGDLEEHEGPTSFDTASVASKENARRIEYLFDHDIYDLPDGERPECHRDGKHTYRSVYGRLRWDEPAQTITTGFTSMGQGRFVHPSRKRTLTPHEAARLQFIPDFFQFGDVQRTKLTEMIGNAVPPKLTYVLALALLR